MTYFNKIVDFFSKKIIATLDNYGVDRGLSAAVLFLLPQIILWIVDPKILLNLLKYILYLSPVILPVVLVFKLWDLWQTYKRAAFLSSQEKVLLKIKVPRKLSKTPKAMELFFNAIHVKPGETTPIKVYLEGATRPWWSFEIVSIEGQIHFYIWTWKRFKDFIETQLYAQFPDIEIYEAEDYMNGISADLSKVSIWGTDYKFEKPDAYPIKTYADFELDKIPAKGEELKVVDPLANVFEKLSSFGPGEFAALQIMVQVTRNKNWKKDVEAEIEKIYKDRSQEITDLADPEKIVQGWAQLRPQDYDLVNTLKHSIEKNAFDVGIRMIYVAKKDKFDGGKIGPNIVHLFRSFSAPHLNYLLGIAHWLAIFDYPWQDYKEIRQNRMRKQIIDAFKRRSYFHPPYKFDPLILTSEELASIYHFPGESVLAPGVEHIASSKSQAPVNLPT
jgi:hypothetical protein